MSWTYNLADLTTPLNQVRLNTGQTNQYSHVAVQDEEINILLLVNGNDVAKASIQTFDAMIMKAAGLVDANTGMQAESLSDLLNHLITGKEQYVKNTIGYQIVATGLFHDEFHEGQQDPGFFHSGSRSVDEGPESSLEFLITVTQTANGTIVPAGDDNFNVFVREFTDQEFIITPAAGFAIDTISVDELVVPDIVNTGHTFTFLDVKENHTITATYIAVP